MIERTGPMRSQIEDVGPTDDAARGFAAVETWVFDLDNTLYPHHVNLWQQVDVRIRDYIADFLKLTHAEAFRLQKDLYRRYGTSLRGLMEEHGLDPDEFLEMVHDIDYSPLTPDPALAGGEKRQPEFERTIQAYLDDATSLSRVARGREAARRFLAGMIDAEDRDRVLRLIARADRALLGGQDEPS